LKHLKRGQGITLGLAVIAAGLAAQPLVGAQAAPTSKADDSVVSRLRDAASGSVDLRSNPATGRVGFAHAEGADPDLLPGVAAEGRRGAIDKASAYLDKFAPAFGARAAELEQTEVYASPSGWSVTFAQSYKGVPVFGGELKAHVDREGDLTSVNGFAAPDLALGVTPRLSKAEASSKALAAVKAKPSGYEDGGPAGYRKGLSVRDAKLTIYRMGTPRGIEGESRLAWAVEVWNKSTVRETLIIDAASGKPLNRWSMIGHALDRELYEAYVNNAGTPNFPDDDFVDGLNDPIWAEGDAFPGGLNEDQQNEVLGTSEAYWMFRNTFGYDSWDGQGSTMRTVNNDPRISCPNANWNGYSTNYCNGVTGDDTVAHEWGHAYTESTSGLIYQWQAGAMNEAYSDIWGETVDMLNERHNETGDPGSTGGTVYRTPGQCSDFTRSDVTMEITAPAGIAGPCTAAPASFGPVFGQTPVEGTAVVGTDPATGTLPDGTPDTSPTNGCQAFTNPGAINGNWVYVDRGACTFGTKAQNADAAGAVGIVVGDSVAGRAPISMSGDADIYGVMVTLADGAKFKNAGEPVSFEIAAVPADTDETHRWLSGESDPAFGGAIRDMWSPNCYGDPGKVSDEEYHCTPDDSGGVHSNSGVVNRTFALLVDGMDGQDTGIGLDKAAWLFWHTQTNYLTPSSYFPDLADGLEESCEVLQDVDFHQVTLGDPQEADGSDGAVAEPELVEGGTTAADCEFLAEVIAETELRMDPTVQCAWEPLLEQGAPSLNCGTGTTTKTTYSEDFEDGLAGWSQDEELGESFSEGIAWEASTHAPDHAGGVAFGPDPVSGTCGAAGDLTSRNGLISPAITVPAGTTPRMSFDHYIATEATWDGGNVKVSVNGGDYAPVPEAAYIFNGPEGELDPRQGPMGGEAAWTGTDGGQLDGSWGTTVVDLTKVAPVGASVKFRFDMGRDGCNGVDGWYVDNVKVQVCEATPTTTPTPTPTATPTPTPTPVDSTTNAKVKPAKPAFKQDFKVVVKVKAEGTVPTGKVTIKIDGKKIAAKRLDDGRLVLKVTKNLKVGSHKLVAVYKGSDTVEGSKDKLKFTVKR
jgi:Zn-dependent metalloprotease